MEKPWAFYMLWKQKMRFIWLNPWPAGIFRFKLWTTNILLMGSIFGDVGFQGLKPKRGILTRPCLGRSNYVCMDVDVHTLRHLWGHLRWLGGITMYVWMYGLMCKDVWMWCMDEHQQVPNSVIHIILYTLYLIIHFEGCITEKEDTYGKCKNILKYTRIIQLLTLIYTYALCSIVHHLCQPLYTHLYCLHTCL